MIFVPSTENDYVIATSYLSVTEANELINAQRNSDEWGLLTLEDKEIALNQSSLAVDGVYAYKDLKTDDSQLLKFPRNGAVVIPASLKYAVALLALKYSKGEDSRDIKSEKIGKLSWTFGGEQHGKNGMTQEILSFLKPLKAKGVRINVI
jgi:hypothetical protein